MSYCRFSSDDWQCEVYVYEDVAGGWTTHVAGRRRVWQVPLPPPIDFNTDLAGWFARERQVVAMLDDYAELVDINGPYDGMSFNDPTPGEAADRLEELRATGYWVPEWAIDSLRSEASDA